MELELAHKEWHQTHSKSSACSRLWCTAAANGSGVPPVGTAPIRWVRGNGCKPFLGDNS